MRQDLCRSLAAGALLSAGSALAQPAWLEIITAPTGVHPMWVTGLARDGSIVVFNGGCIGNTCTTPRAYRWVRGEGSALLPPPGATPDTMVGAITPDGAMAFGTLASGAGDVVRWTGLADPVAEDLGGPPVAHVFIAGVSADGRTAVGNARPSTGGGSRCFVWRDTGSPGGVFEFLPSAPGMAWAEAAGISADGHVVVGHAGAEGADSRAVRWVDGAAPTDLGAFAGGPYSIAMAASADGSTVVGFSTRADNSTEAFRWTTRWGVERLGGLLPSGVSEAWSVSLDGSLIAGTTGTAAVWTRAWGWRTVVGLLSRQGIDVDGTGAQLVLVEAMSGNGASWAGEAVDASGRIAGWVAHLRPPCAVDYNGDLVAGIGDVLTFFQLYSTGNRRADFDGNGQVTIPDFLAFLSAYAAGC